jgi:hypothetical protein
VALVIGTQREGGTMTSTMRNLRRAVALLGLTGALAVIGVTAGPGLAQGPSPAQLAEQGWTCVAPPIPWVGARCYHPGEGHPPIPPVEDGRATYTAIDWAPGGEFLGHVHMIRPDLYAGQPCPQMGGPYVFNLLRYYQCFRYF